MDRVPTNVTVLLAVVLLAAAPVIAWHAPFGQAAQTDEVDGCTTIEQPGTYTLTQNVEIDASGGSTDSGDASACIRIRADDVVIRGNRNHVTGPGSGVGIRSLGRTNVTVRDVAVTDWRTGIHVENTTDASIVGLAATNNAGSGISVFDSPGATIRDVEVAASGEFGIEVRNASAATLANATVDDTGGNGIHLMRSPNATVESAVVRRSGWRGVNVYASSGATVANVTTVDSPLVGLSLSTSEDVTVRSVDVTNSGSGVFLLFSDGNDIYDVTVTESEIGLELHSSYNVTVRNTTASDNRLSGLVAFGTDDLVVRDSTFDDNRQYGVEVDSSENASLHDVSADGNRWSLASTGSAEVSVTGFDVGPGTASFTMTDVVVRPVTDPPPAAEGLGATGQFLEVARSWYSIQGWLNVTFHYPDEAVADLDESSLRIWLFDGSWSPVREPNRVDIERNVVTANVTSNGTVAPLAIQTNASLPFRWLRYHRPEGYGR